MNPENSTHSDEMNDRKRSGTVLDRRQRSLLKALIEDYIDQAEPVGSKSLVDRHQLPLSPASVRNSLAELERLGYLNQPHASAGRVPSDLGYRIYVDDLMTPEAPDQQTRTKVQEGLSRDFAEWSELLTTVSGLLSETTGYTSMVLSPQFRQSRLAELKLLLIQRGQAMLILILNDGLVRSRLIRVSEHYRQEQIRRVAVALDAQLAGLPLEALTSARILEALEEAPEGAATERAALAREIDTALKQAESDETFVDGVPNIFSYPEFRAADKARSLLYALSDAGGLTAMLKTSPMHFRVRIGREIDLEALQDCSCVMGDYEAAPGVRGVIAVVGPTRMHYARVVSHLNYVRERLRHLMRTNDADSK